MRFTKTTFVFTPDFGARLRQLRKRRNLSLRDLALLMDRHQPGSFNLLAKLERGDLKHPSINLIADFLRACRATVKDIADLLDTYVEQAPVLREKADAAVAELLKSLPKAEQWAPTLQFPEFAREAAKMVADITTAGRSSCHPRRTPSETAKTPRPPRLGEDHPHVTQTTQIAPGGDMTAKTGTVSPNGDCTALSPTQALGGTVPIWHSFSLSTVFAGHLVPGPELGESHPQMTQIVGRAEHKARTVPPGILTLTVPGSGLTCQRGNREIHRLRPRCPDLEVGGNCESISVCIHSSQSAAGQGRAGH